MWKRSSCASGSGLRTRHAVQPFHLSAAVVFTPLRSCSRTTVILRGKLLRSRMCYSPAAPTRVWGVRFEDEGSCAFRVACRKWLCSALSHSCRASQLAASTAFLMPAQSLLDTRMVATSITWAQLVDSPPPALLGSVRCVERLR